MKSIVLIYVCVLLVIGLNSKQFKRTLGDVFFKKVDITVTAESGCGARFDSLANECAAKIGVPIWWLYAVIESESGWNSHAKNPYTGAFGLIQFLPSTLAGMGSSVSELETQSAEAQLPLIAEFYRGYTFKSLIDLRLFTFYPAAVGKDDSWVIGGALTAKQNRIYDLDHSGAITVGEFKEYYSR